MIKFKNCKIEKYNNNLYRFRKTINKKVIQVYGHTIKEVKEKFNIKLKNINNNIENNKNKDITLKEYFLEWVEIYKKGKCKDTTIDYYIRKFKHVLNDNISNYPINAINIRDINLFLSKIEKKRLKEQIKEILKDIFNKAYINELIKKDISIYLKIEKLKSKNNYLLSNNYNEFFKICDNLRYGDFYKILLLTGMRKGEALALQFCDIDFINKTININKALNEKKEISTTKTDKIRIIPCSNKVLDIFNKLKINKNDNDYIFKINEKYMYTEFKKYIGNIFHITLHDLRHSFATYLNEQKIDIKTISYILGHSDTKTTLNIYTHITNNNFNDLYNILNK